MSNENKQAVLVNKIAVCFDLINQYQNELFPETRQNLKRITKESMNHTNRLIKTFDSILSEKHANNFGDDADYIREKFDKIFRSEFYFALGKRYFLNKELNFSRESMLRALFYEKKHLKSRMFWSILIKSLFPFHI